MQPDWYHAWRDEAFEQLTAKNARLEQDFRLGHWTRYNYDLAAGKLIFSDKAGTTVISEIQIAGSTSAKAGNWLWAWANSNLPGELLGDAKLVRAFGEKGRGRPGPGLCGRYERRFGCARLGIDGSDGSGLQRAWSLSLLAGGGRRSLSGLQDHTMGELIQHSEGARASRGAGSVNHQNMCFRNSGRKAATHFSWNCFGADWRPSVGRHALPSRAAVGLECVVRGAIRTVAVIAPLHMRIAAVDAVVLAVDDGAGDQRAGGESSKRKPIVAMTAIAVAIFTIAAMAVPVDSVTTTREIPVEAAVPSPIPILHGLDIRQGLGLRHISWLSVDRHHLRRDERRRESGCQQARCDLVDYSSPRG